MVSLSSLRSRSKLVTPVALVASVAFHVGLIAVCARWASETLSEPEVGRTVDVTFAEVPPGDAQRASSTRAGASDVSDIRRPEDEHPEPSSGPLQDPRPDTLTAGHGGSREAAQKALHLSDSVDGLTLDADPTFLTANSQLSRLETADERRSREDRRATPNPMELTFVSSGTGTRLSRLVPASTDPAEGALGATPGVEGAHRIPDESAGDGFRLARVAVNDGGRPTPALGVDHGSEREDYRRSAAVALARPSVREGRASIATARHGRPNDTVDSSEEVASAVQSLITASSAGGPQGRGPGGSAGGGVPGSAGVSGPGSRARPLGEGGALDATSVLGIRSYAAALTRKVYPYWEDALPMWARAEGRGGVAIIGVTIGENGSIRELHVVRGSGIPEFDQKVATALERASPYGPLPHALRAGGLELHIAFDAMNPAVGRSGPGPGRR